MFIKNHTNGLMPIGASFLIIGQYVHLPNLVQMLGVGV